jgi:hypothetical protein
MAARNRLNGDGRASMLGIQPFNLLNLMVGKGGLPRLKLSERYVEIDRNTLSAL